jgi:hypothetical protein
MCVRYQPAESDSGLFGGNSNWRGTHLDPVNYLLVESLEKFHKYYGDDFTVECPTGSGTYLTIREIANEPARRWPRIFQKMIQCLVPFSMGKRRCKLIPISATMYCSTSIFMGTPVAESVPHIRPVGPA